MYTLLREKALADYQCRYKPEVNQAGVRTYGTTVPELSIALCTIWDYLIISMFLYLKKAECQNFVLNSHMYIFTRDK